MTGGMCFRAKIDGKCMSEHSFCYSIIYLGINIQETQFPIANFFLGTEANVLLRIIYYNAPGASFEALVQRTGGYTNLL